MLCERHAVFSMLQTSLVVAFAFPLFLQKEGNVSAIWAFLTVLDNSSFWFWQ